MSDPEVLATYSFLPWLRQGLANTIETAPAAGTGRASITVDVEVGTDTRPSTTPSPIVVELVGPADVIGISADAIVRHDPRHWLTDFEPNYLPLIEFYDEDFPWRYSPMPVDRARHRLIPWITLVVLAETEFSDSAAPTGPLPALATRGAGAEVFPAVDQLWAWAHVHVNSDVKIDAGGGPLSDEAASGRLEQLLDQNPDLGNSRLLCPRRLDPDTAYHAFLIPTFETGRLAGLGQAVGAGVGALDVAWAGAQTTFPYYYRWYFRTGARGDFEYLARRLEARPVDEHVGIRDLDVSNRGAGIPAIEVGPDRTPVIGMEGALRSPDTRSTTWPEAYPEAFQKELAQLLNRAADDQDASPATDPVVSPDIYGRWHALRERLSLVEDTGANPYDPQAKWLTELNLDPRHRAAAGLGARIVRDDQEALMNEAWRQLGEVLEANRRLKIAQLAEIASLVLHTKHLTPLAQAIRLALTAPVHKRVLDGAQTVFRKTQESKLPGVVLSPEFRRATRPRGALMKRLLPADALRPQADLLARINAGEITATPPKTAPEGALTLGGTLELPPWLQDLLRQKGLDSLLLAIALVVLLLLVIVAGALGLSVGTAVLIALGQLAALLHELAKKVEALDTVSERGLTPEAVDELPQNSGFRVTAPEDTTSFPAGGADSAEASRFKAALKDLHGMLVDVPAPPPARPALPIDRLAELLMRAIDPRVTLKRRVFATISLPSAVRARMPDAIVPVMAYPEFSQPMYEPLPRLSSEYLIPNVNLVPQNTISLLVSNPKFIEAFMVGLNHEMARELLWREYPTDQRGSYFRQFWDVRDVVPADGSATAVELAEKLKDIPEIHTWPSTTELGTHNHRQASGLVLLIRGDLLKRYPNTIIYIHRAAWPVDPAGQPKTSDARHLAQAATEAERRANQRYPLYSAKIEPDVFFLGFDLTVEEARGQGDDPGWFFVLKERVGEPRFGLDLEDAAVSAPLADWDDLTWDDVAADFRPGKHIGLPEDPGKVRPGHDAGMRWSAGSNAAEIAFILFQDPVLVAVHAEEMLKR